MSLLCISNAFEFTKNKRIKKWLKNIFVFVVLHPYQWYKCDFLNILKESYFRSKKIE